MTMEKKYIIVQKKLEKMIVTGKLKPGERLPTEEEICNKYMVSRTTAGRALNGLVMKNLALRQARTGTFVKNREINETGFFFLISPGFRYAPRTKAADKFSATISKKNRRAAILISDHANDELIKCVISAGNNNCAGIAIHPLVDYKYIPQLLKTIYDIHQPTVIYYRCLSGFNGVQIIIDDEQCVELAVAHLVGKGRKKIAFVGVNNNSDSQVLRYNGFCNACAKFGINSKQFPILVFYDPFQLPNLKSIFSSKNAPDSLVVISEYHALLAYDILTTLGIKIPEEVAIVTLDGSFVSTSTEVPFTAIEFPVEEVCREAANVLYQMNIGVIPQDTKYIKKVPGKLVIRDSSGCGKLRRHDYLQEMMTMLR